ncbi:MAG TPA: hypothetical protein VFY73_15170 [Ideonella sp.]|uniref:hypothetical protein n=1 Tax=Ideonella sp. TaxID=1929293 RepID=UPI002E321632|nr:hypothetical protein [Ideonella sp.]HEX5685363.1 hypothetical protein [Ideonella sp.]
MSASRHRWSPALVAVAALIVCLDTPIAAHAAICPMAWSPVQVVRASDGDLNVRPQVGVDAAGWAMAVWTELDAGATEHILFARRPPKGVWSAPQEVFQSTGLVPVSSELDLAVGAGGHALLTWRRQGFADDVPWVTSFDPNAGWAAPVALRVPTEKGPSPASVAVNARGEGVVSWLASGGVYTRIFQPLAGWSAIHRGRDWKVGIGPTWGTRVAMNDAGQAVVAWETLRPRAMRFDPTTGWQAPETLLDHGRVNQDRVPEVTIAPTGDAFVTWADEEHMGANLAVFVSHFQPAKGWAPAQRLSGPNYHAWSPDVATNAQGQALVAWSVERPRPQTRLEATLYRPGTGWGPVIAVSEIGGSFSQVEADLSDIGIATITSRHWDDDLSMILMSYTMQRKTHLIEVTRHEGMNPNHDVAGQGNGGQVLSGVDWSGQENALGRRGTLQARVREHRCDAATGR